MNALRLKVFWGELADEQADRQIEIFQERKRGGFYYFPELGRTQLLPKFYQFCRHTQKLGCRTLDVLHVVCASLIEADQFVSYDTRQCQLAEEWSWLSCLREIIVFGLMGTSTPILVPFLIYYLGTRSWWLGKRFGYVLVLAGLRAETACRGISGFLMPNPDPGREVDQGKWMWSMLSRRRFVSMVGSIASRFLTGSKVF